MTCPECGSNNINWDGVTATCLNCDCTDDADKFRDEWGVEDEEMEADLGLLGEPDEDW